ncbi:MAG: hypothetical protein NTZ90_09930 [Proteobacteria bacterium]|nr:hypothetical protein [Pseudomonadota bacterium]
MSLRTITSQFLWMMLSLCMLAATPATGAGTDGTPASVAKPVAIGSQWALRDRLRVTGAQMKQQVSMPTISGVWTFSPCSATVTDGFADTLVLRDDGTFTELQTVFSDSSCQPRAIVSRVEGVYFFKGDGTVARRLTLVANKATAGADGRATLRDLSPPVWIFAHFELDDMTLSLAIDSDSGPSSGAYSKLSFPYRRTWTPLINITQEGPHGSG